MSKIKEQPVCLFDLDQTLCDYDQELRVRMEELRSPSEDPAVACVVPRDNAPAYLKRRANLIRLSEDWWANLPRLQLGFDIWNLAGKLGFWRAILTQGPRGNPNAWSGKKKWIDKNLGPDTDITITRDKSRVYGKILVDDWPEYVEGWLEHRPRGLVIMPASSFNAEFTHPRVIRYDGTNIKDVEVAMLKSHSS